MELSNEVKELIERGYTRIGDPNPVARDDEFERCRIIARKWRNLVGEARYDIPNCLHRYVNWLLPEHWAAHKRPSRIEHHDFKIEIPTFATVHVHYKVYNYADWLFNKFEIIECATPVASIRYYDLPMFLAIARDVKRSKKQDVQIEEIDGGLADNAKLIKLNNPSLSKVLPQSLTGYVLTESDFLNNPGADDDDNFQIYP